MTNTNLHENQETPPAEIERLAAYIRDASKMREEISYFQRDKDLEQRGWTFHYAVDTDVISMFLSPEKMGPTEKKRKGYGVVFHDDTDENALNLASAMGRFLFNDLASSERPFLLLHGHDAEVREIYDTKVRAAQNDKYVLKTERDAMLSELENITSVSDSVIESLTDKFPAVMNYLFLQSGTMRELERFQKLLKTQSIARVRHAVHSCDYYIGLRTQKLVHSIFTYPHSLKHQIEESKYRIDWKDRLKAVRKQKKGHRLKADYSALARIELLNDYLKDHQHRIVLITGDSTIIKAASSYSWRHSNRSFREEFIRQPRAFLTAPEVIAPFQDAETGSEQQAPELITDWLDYLLAFSAPGDSIDFDKLNEEVGDDINGFVETIRTRWRSHLTSLKNLYGVINTDAKHELQKLVAGREKEEFVSIVEEIVKDKTEESLESWNDFLDVLITAGYALIDVEDEQAIVKRNAPPVMLSNFQTAYDLLQRISSKSDKPDDVRELIDELTAGREDSERHYVRALAYGVLFASRGRWVQAAQLADHALDWLKLSGEIIEGSIPDFFITGREAQYLKAIAVRISATKPAELDVAKRAIQLAGEAVEREAQLLQQETWHKMRFTCEEVNQDFTAHLFEHFSNVDHPSSNCEADLSLIVRKYQVLFTGIDTIEDSWIKMNIGRSICTNILMISALCEHSSLDIDCRSAHEHLEDNLRNSESDYALPVSFLVKAVRLYGRCKFFEGNSRDRHILRDELQYCLHQLTHESNSIVQTPYDRKRYNLLFRLSHRLLAKASIKPQA